MLPSPDTIAHFDLDSFYVSVERLKDSRLVGKPIMIGGKSDRAVVASCSYEARAFGVRSAMPMKLAKRLCPEATCISGDFEAYSHHSKVVTDVIREAAPLYEKASIDEFYLDLTGMDRFFGSWKWAKELRGRIINETGLPISLGVSVNKMVAKVATGEAKPNGQRQIPRQEVEGFLGPMHIRKLPFVGPKMTQKLAQMGIQQVADLREIPKELLVHVFGKNGKMLWERSRGIDHSPVVPDRSRKSISMERTFETDIIDVERMSAILTRMAGQLGHRLRVTDQQFGCVALKMRYANFDTVTRQVSVPLTTRDDVIIEKALQLFEKLYQRRLRVRLIGLRLTNLHYGNHQISLFEDTPQQLELYQAIDHLKTKFGEQVIGRGSEMYKK